MIDELMAILTPIDEAMRRAEDKWGVGRLERLVSTDTLQAFRRGWLAWCAAIEGNDLGQAAELAPRMVKMLAIMDQRATESGAQPLSVDTYEALMPDGRVLVVCRTSAEASAIGRAAKLGADADLPPDLLAAVRQQHAGRDLVVWTMAELAQIVERYELVNQICQAWPGARITAGPITSEGDTTDWLHNDPVRSALELEFDA